MEIKIGRAGSFIFLTALPLFAFCVSKERNVVIGRLESMNDAVNHDFIEDLQPASQLILAKRNADQAGAARFEYPPQLLDGEEIGFRIALDGIIAGIVDAIIETHMFKHGQANHSRKAGVAEVQIAEISENIRDALLPETLSFRRESNNADVFVAQPRMREDQAMV